MTQRPPGVDEPFDEEEEDELEAPDSGSFIEAHSAFRLLVVLVAIWSFIQGFALFTGGIEALSLNSDRMAERIIGAQLIVLSPVFALLAWRRDQYRLLLWLPYAAQLALIIPIGMSFLSGSSDGALLFVISSILFVLLFYFWWHSHPLDYYQQELDGDAEDVDEDEEPADNLPATPRGGPEQTRPAVTPPPRPDDASRRQARFRRRDP